MAQGNYIEVIFKRLEKEGFRTADQIVEWLAADKSTVFDKNVKVKTQKSRDRESYAQFARTLAEPFEIAEAAERAEAAGEYEELRQLQIQASNLNSKFGAYRTFLVKEIDDRMKPIAKELEEIRKEKEREEKAAEDKRIADEKRAVEVRREVLRRESQDRRVRRNAQRRLSRLERRIASEIAEGEELIEEIE